MPGGGSLTMAGMFRGAWTMMMLATAVTCLSVCNFTDDVNTTSHTLFLTCEYRTSSDIELQILQINQIKEPETRTPLVWVTSNMENGTASGAESFKTLKAEFSETYHHALIALAFDFHYENRNLMLTFECLATGMDYFHEPHLQLRQLNVTLSDYYTTTTSTSTTTVTTPEQATTTTTITSNKSPLTVETKQTEGRFVLCSSVDCTTTSTVTAMSTSASQPRRKTSSVSSDTRALMVEEKNQPDGKPELSTLMLAMIIAFSLVIVALVFIIVIFAYRRRKQNGDLSRPPPPCRPSPKYGVPWDIVMYLIETIRSMNSRGDEHVTPSPPDSSSHEGGSVPSGSYAECLTPTMSIFSVNVPPRDVEWSDDVSGQATERNMLVDNYVSAVSDFNPNDCNRDVTYTNTAVASFMRPPAPLAVNPTPLWSCSFEQNPPPFSPPTTHISPLNFENVPSPVSPPSPELQRLPIALFPPRDFCRTRPVPAEAEADVKQFSETQLWGGGRSTDTVCGWKDGRGTAERDPEGGGHEACQLDQGPVRFNESAVRLDEGPVRYDEGTARTLWGRAGVLDRRDNPTYLTPV